MTGCDVKVTRIIKDLKVLPMFDFTIVDTDQRETLSCRISKNTDDLWVITLKQNNSVIKFGSWNDEKFNSLLINFVIGKPDFAHTSAAAIRVIFEKYKDIFDL